MTGYEVEVTGRREYFPTLCAAWHAARVAAQESGRVANVWRYTPHGVFLIGVYYPDGSWSRV